MGVNFKPRGLISPRFFLIATILFLAPFGHLAVNEYRKSKNEIHYISHDLNVNYSAPEYRTPVPTLITSPSAKILRNTKAKAFSVNSQKGYWMTAAHFVEGCSKIYFEVGNQVFDVTEIWRHPYSDLALVKTSLRAPSMLFQKDGRKVPANAFLIVNNNNITTAITLTFLQSAYRVKLNGDTREAVDIWGLPKGNLNLRGFDGLSGSPLVDGKGNVVSILGSRGSSSNFVIAANKEAMSDFKDHVYFSNSLELVNKSNVSWQQDVAKSIKDIYCNK